MLIQLRRQSWRFFPYLAIPALSVAIALVLRLMLASIIPNQSPFLLFFAAVMGSAYYGPRSSGFITAILSALIADYFFFIPYYQFGIRNIGDAVEIGLFLIESALICRGVVMLKGSRQNVQLSQLRIVQQQKMLQQKYTELEQQVQERTQKLLEINEELKDSLSLYQESDLALSESERRLELALESSGDGWWDWDIPTGTFNLSDRWLTMLGYGAGDFPAHLSPWEHLTHPDDFPWVMETLQAHLKDPIASLYRFDYRVLNRAGEWKWIANYGKVVDWDRKGKPIRMVGMHRDVNDRKLAEQELLKSEYILRSFFDNASMMMGLGEVLGDDIRLISLNRAAANFLGSTPEAMQNQFLSQLGQPDEIRPLWISHFQKSKRTGNPVQFEQEYQAPDISMWLSVTISPIQGTLDRLQFSFIVEDVSARKQIESSIAASLQEKEVLLKEVHHRVKNNLQVICSLLNLQARAGQNAVLAEQLNESRNRVKSMALVHEKLYQANSLSKIELNEYIRDLAKHLLRSYGHKSSETRLKIDIDPAILVDIDMAVPCGLIINELITNAFKHAFEPNQPGEIDILGSLGPDGCVMLTVQDNGKGLPSDWSLETNETLGLELVKDLTGQLRAEIEIDSIMGTRFKIIFPAQIN
jgi:PAS domain S-box-containing protein